MTLIIAYYNNVEDFRAVAEPYLSRHEARNNLLLSLISYMAGTNHETGAAHYWTVLDGDLIVGVALRTGDGRALVFSEMPPSCIVLLAADVKKHIPALSEINGPVEVVEAFAAAFGRKTSVFMHLGAYSCASAVIPKVTTGGFRKATFDDLELLIGWNEALHLESMGAADGDHRVMPTAAGGVFQHPSHSKYRDYFRGKTPASELRVVQKIKTHGRTGQNDWTRGRGRAMRR